MILQKAQSIAQEIVNRLTSLCEKDRCVIAGSIRRLKPEVHDIEIVCQPKTTNQYDLFQNVIGSDRNQTFINEVQQLGEIEIGKPTVGRYVKIMLPEGIKLDLFIPQPLDYFRQLAIRTGSSDYSKKIAIAWRQKGWVGTEDGLRSDKECYSKDLGGGKTKWICETTTPILPPNWTSERAFFDWLGMEYLEPNNRV